MLLAQALGVLFFAACGFGRHVPDKLRVRQDTPDAQARICGDIIDAVNNGSRVFWASDAFSCLTSVPFNSAVATRFVQYWNETIQFQSTLAYLKNPPQGYQQPAVDVLAELERIQQRVNVGSYANQYDFEADFQLLTYALHDGHVYLTAGVLSAFSFASPFEIASVSIDGKQAPKVYITADIINSPAQGWTPSAITRINGTEVNSFLTHYAALNSWGYLESHAEWNALMSHPALDIQGGLTTFSGLGTFYPGDDLTFTFENGTSVETFWLAIYNELANYTGPLTTGGDFYNYFVLGLLPDSFDPTKIISPTYSDEAVPEVTSWSGNSSGAFPENPAVVQSDLGILRGGFVTGYVYKNISTGVLSLPAFDVIPDTIGNYSTAVNQFITIASEARLQRIVIDLQQNYGGATLLPYILFKNFFPDLSPFAGSRRRSFPMGNVLGSATTDYWAALNDQIAKGELAADEWVITNRINAATGNNFTSWREYQGPVTANGDTFSLTEQYDLANIVFDTAAFDQWFPVMYLPNKTAWPVQERSWNPDQIVLLTDGLCASACSLFVEMMTRVGVRTVVAGGRPVNGPMQAASGTRGAIQYSSKDLDSDFSFARSIDDSVAENTNGSIPEVREPGIYTLAAGFNVRDQIRKNDTTPLQFRYEAADCRIYYTLANLYNMTQLWHDVSNAAFVDPSKCVDGSRGFSTTNTTSPSPPPKPQVQKPILSLNGNVADQLRFDDNPDHEFRSGYGRSIGGNEITLCPTSGVCPDGKSQCKPVQLTCTDERVKEVKLCLPACTNRKASGTCVCDILNTQESKVGLGRQANFGQELYSGLCKPKVGTRALGCGKNPPPQ